MDFADCNFVCNLYHSLLFFLCSVCVLVLEDGGVDEPVLSLSVLDIWSGQMDVVIDCCPRSFCYFRPI